MEVPWTSIPARDVTTFHLSNEHRQSTTDSLDTGLVAIENTHLFQSAWSQQALVVAVLFPALYNTHILYITAEELFIYEPRTNSASLTRRES